MRHAPKRTIAKYTPMNVATMVGVVHDVQFGFLPNDDPCVQFALTHNVLDLDVAAERRAAAEDQASPSSSLARSSPSFCAKQQITVRVVGSVPAVHEVKASVTDGTVVKVIGQFKANSQMEGGKKQPFPYLLCSLPARRSPADEVPSNGAGETKEAIPVLPEAQRSGAISIIHGPRARLQPAVAAAAEASAGVFKTKGAIPLASASSTGPSKGAK